MSVKLFIPAATLATCRNAPVLFSERSIRVSEVLLLVSIQERLIELVDKTLSCKLLGVFGGCCGKEIGLLVIILLGELSIANAVAVS